MVEHQHQDNQIQPIIEYVHKDQKLPKKFVYQIKSKHTCKLALQWDRLILKQSMLHQLYIYNKVEYHQLVLPQRYHRKILTALHDNMGHQGIDRTMDLLRERVYWPSMACDAQNWITNCHRCQTAHGNYMEPKPKICHLEANNPLDWVLYLCNPVVFQFSLTDWGRVLQRLKGAPLFFLHQCPPCIEGWPSCLMQQAYTQSKGFYHYINGNACEGDLLQILWSLLVS